MNQSYKVENWQNTIFALGRINEECQAEEKSQKTQKKVLHSGRNTRETDKRPKLIVTKEVERVVCLTISLVPSDLSAVGQAIYIS